MGWLTAGDTVIFLLVGFVVALITLLAVVLLVSAVVRAFRSDPNQGGNP